MWCARAHLPFRAFADKKIICTYTSSTCRVVWLVRFFAVVQIAFGHSHELNQPNHHHGKTGSSSLVHGDHRLTDFGDPLRRLSNMAAEQGYGRPDLRDVVMGPIRRRRLTEMPTIHECACSSERTPSKPLTTPTQAIRSSEAFAVISVESSGE